MSEETPRDGGQTVEPASQQLPSSYPELLAIRNRQLETQIKAQLWMLTALVETSQLSDAFRREMLKQTLHLANQFYTEEK